MQQTEDMGKYTYFFPQTVVMIGVGRNIMPAAWHTPVSAEPPLYGISISPERYTFEQLEKADGFTVNFLECDKAITIAQTGSVSGRDIDKLERFGIKYMSAEKVDGPILTAGYAAYECKKHAVAQYGDHYLFIGRIILIHFQEGILTSDQLVDTEKVSPILYFGKDRYITTDPQTLAVFTRDRI